MSGRIRSGSVCSCGRETPCSSVGHSELCFQTVRAGEEGMKGSCTSSTRRMRGVGACAHEFLSVKSGIQSGHDLVKRKANQTKGELLASFYVWDLFLGASTRLSALGCFTSAILVACHCLLRSKSADELVK